MALDIAGSNSGALSEAEQISENLNDKHPKLKERAEELNGMLARLPASVEDEETADKVSEAVRQCTEYLKTLESTRVEETEVYLAGQRAVMGWSRSLSKLVTIVKDRALRLRSDYDIAVENRERARREEEARKAREEADRLRKEAAAREATQRDAERAAQAEQRAEEARAAAKAAPAELTRTRTVSGVTTSLKTVWDFEILEDRQVPRKFCKADAGLIRAAVKSAVTPDNECPLEIKGVRIFKRSFSQVR